MNLRITFKKKGTINSSGQQTFETIILKKQLKLKIKVQDYGQ